VIDPKKTALKTIISQEGGEDFLAQLFDQVGHIFRLESVFRLFLEIGR
jgi:hypothetical protein